MSKPSPLVAGGALGRWLGLDGLPGGTSGRDPARQSRRSRRRGFDSWVGKISGVGHSNPLQYYRLGNPMDREVHGVTKSWTRLSTHTLTGLDEVTRVGPHPPYGGISAFKGRGREPEPFLSAIWGQWEGSGLSGRQEESPYQNSTTLAPWFQTCRLWNCGKINICCSSCLVCGSLAGAD